MAFSSRFRAKKPNSHRSKHGNRCVYITPDGKWVRSEHTGPKTKCFDSIGEWKYWLLLIERQNRGEITGLQKQVRFPLKSANGDVITKYVADYVFIENGERRVLDYKGMITPTFKMKKKWLKSDYGIDVIEVKL